ncbi:MAG TPA: glycosyltransferase family 4 protein [Acidobacteriota bacterium]|nr:glycosyltransferase family 4 protein [Acidobacteriota bacterium]
MNILFLDAIDRDTFGGYENWILLTARHMQMRGHRVTVAGRAGSEYLRRAGLLSNGIDILEVAIGGDFNPATIYRLKSFLDRRDVDVMTVNFNKDVRLGGLAARWHGGTSVIWRLGLDITKNGLVHRLLTPHLVDGVIVPSQALKRQVIRHGYLTDSLVRVIHNGTEIKDFARPDPAAARRLREAYGLPEQSVVAVTAGRFVDQKGHVYLVEAAPELIRRHPDLRFLWLGNGPLEGMLRARLDELKLSDYFVFAGMLDNIDTPLAGADFMIHPAVEEPFSHAILEAMRAGLPIVASRVGGTPEAIIDGETGFLISPGQPLALVNGVDRLLADRDNLHRLGLAGQKRWRQNFTIERMVDKVEEYFSFVARKGEVREPA